MPSTILFEGYIGTSDAREMFARIDRPKGHEPKRWIYLQHGLMDNSAKWDPIAKVLIGRGYGLIRIDLHGHGKTLQRALEKNQATPVAWEARVLLADLANVLATLEKKFGIARPAVVGHSLGGGLALAMTAIREYAGLLGDVVVPIAPYVYRLDWRQIEKVADLHPVTSFWIRSMRQALPHSFRASLEAVTTDPAMDRAMSKSFGEHGRKEVETDHPDWTPEAKARWVDESVRAAIAVTKGIRPLDNRHLASDIDPRFRFTMVVAGRDTLLDQPLEMELFEKIATGDEDRLIMVRDAGHFVTRQAPELIVKIIVDAVEGRGPIERISRFDAGIE